MNQTQNLRMSGIGGSDAGIILGLSKYKTPMRLAEEKLGLVESFKGNRFTEAGNRLEEVIAKWYADETGSKVAKANQTFRLKEHDFIMAHIDRRVLNERKLLECKSADKWTISSWGDPGSDEVPDTYFVQVQHYLMFPNWDSADLAALIGGNDLRIYGIEPDTELQDMILHAEINFWETIKRGDLPDPINMEDATRRWNSSGITIYADNEVLDWHNELKKAQVSQKELTEKIEDLKTKIMVYMKDASTLLDPKGNKIHSWKEQGTSGFRLDDFKREHPDVYEDCKFPQFDKTFLKKTRTPMYEVFQIRKRVFR